VGLRFRVFFDGMVERGWQPSLTAGWLEAHIKTVLFVLERRHVGEFVT
jgi:hypothetical protein